MELRHDQNLDDVSPEQKSFSPLTVYMIIVIPQDVKRRAAIGSADEGLLCGLQQIDSTAIRGCSALFLLGAFRHALNSGLIA